MSAVTTRRAWSDWVSHPMATRLMDEIYERHWEAIAPAPRWSEGEMVTFVVMKPQSVNDDWHVVIHDRNLRDRARKLLASENYKHFTNDPHPNAVLVLCPIQ